VKGEITIEKKVRYFFACGDAVFILTAELWGMQQQLFTKTLSSNSNPVKPQKKFASNKFFLEKIFSTIIMRAIVRYLLINQTN
jgi:hypothetical protein